MRRNRPRQTTFRFEPDDKYNGAHLAGFGSALPDGLASLSGCVDLTVEEKANGKEVVEATVDLINESCIFDDDKLMLRRIAYVETTDGEDDHTFEKNGNDYYGGIWQVGTLRTMSNQSSLLYYSSC